MVSRTRKVRKVLRTRRSRSNRRVSRKKTKRVRKTRRSNRRVSRRRTRRKMKGGSGSEKWEDALPPPAKEGDKCSVKILCDEGLRCVLYPHSVTGSREQIQAGVGRCVKEEKSLTLDLKNSGPWPRRRR